MEMRNTSSKSRDIAAKELEKIFVKYGDFSTTKTMFDEIILVHL